MKRIKSYLIIFSGVVLMSFGIGMFCIPNKIVSGGVSGISTILLYVLKIPAGISYYAINLILLIVGYRVLSKRFIIRTLICSGLVSFFVDIFSEFPPVTNNLILATLFGGILYGVGIALTLIEDSSTGGTDVLGRIIQNEKKHISIGKILMIIDLVIIFISFIFFGEIDLTLYGILTLYVSTNAIDLFIRKLNVSKLVFVVTEYGEEISKKLVNEHKRGVTLINAKGAYTQNKKSILMCAMKEKELTNFKDRVLSIDKDAFIVFSESQEILGNGFFIYR